MNQLNQMELFSKRWSFTAWKEPKTKLHLVSYIIWQSELCPTTNTRHYQGYVEFPKEYQGKYVKSLFRDKTIHVEVSDKCKEANAYYCGKKDTKNGETFEFTNNNNKLVKSIWDELPIE